VPFAVVKVEVDHQHRLIETTLAPGGAIATATSLKDAEPMPRSGPAWWEAAAEVDGDRTRLRARCGSAWMVPPHIKPLIVEHLLEVEVADRDAHDAG